MGLIRFFSLTFGIQTAGLINLAGKVTQIPCRLGSLLLVGTFLTENQQGFYFTIISLIALQQFFELSLNIVIVNTTSHFWPKLRIKASGHLEGASEQLGSLQKLCRFLLYWYCFAGILFVAIVGYGGYLFLSQQTVDDVTWQAPWFFIVFLVGLSLPITGFANVLEGAHQLKAVYIAQFFQTILALVFVATLLTLSLNIWAACSFALAQLITNTVLIIKYRKFFSIILHDTIKSNFHWKTDVFPWHWKVGLQSLVGYFSNQLITPALFIFHGPILAGQFGMSWQIILGIQQISFAIFQSQIPKFGSLASQKLFKELDRLAINASLLATTMTALGIASAGSIFYLLVLLEMEIANRILPLPLFLLLLAALLPMVWTHCIILYVRAQRQEPFLVQNVINSILLGGGNYLLAQFYDVESVILGYNLIFYCIVLPWALFTLKRVNRERRNQLY